jgi:hypothetical protein
VIESLRDRRASAIVLAVLIVAGAVFCIGEPIWQLLVKGPFSWHMQRPRTWQGGIEVLALGTLLAGVATLASARWRLVLTLVFAELYLRRHFVDLPFLVDVAYLELLIGLGALASRWTGMPPARETLDYLRCAVAGIVLWSIGAWLLSAFGIGSVRALRIYTLVLAIPVLIARQTPLCVFLWRRMDAHGAAQRAGLALLLAWLLCLMARTNIVSGYDAWWYGLRGEYVLVAAGSVFESLGLVAPVHYYPKLYELLLIPLSALGDTSVILGISMLMLVLFALTASEFLKRLQLGFGARLMLVALCVTLPAVANSALAPKPDLFSGWLLLFACVTAMRYARDGLRSEGLWTLLLCMLACASKLSAPPYAVVLIATALVVRFRHRSVVTQEPASALRFAAVALAGSFLACVLVTWRTWVLAGIPLVGPQQIVDLLAKFGITRYAHVGLLSGGPPFEWGDLPLLMTDLLFRPQVLPHIVIAWIGNVWLYLFVLAALAWGLRARPERPAAPAASAIAWALFVVGLLLMLFFRTITRGGDGGYFLLPMSLGILLGGAAVLGNLAAGWPQRLLFSMLSAFVLFHATYSFASAAWATGTRPFDFDFTQSVRDTKVERRKLFHYEGIERIAEYLRKAPRPAHVIGYVRHHVGFRLQATFEHLIYYKYWYTAPLADANAFLRYLQDARIDYLILPKPERQKSSEVVDAVVADAAAIMSRDPSVHVIDDLQYVLYDLADLHAKARCAAPGAESSAPAAAACAPSPSGAGSAER